MAFVVNKNYTDTAISGATDKTKLLAKINYSTDFALKTRSANEAILTNLTSPVGFPEQFRTGVTIHPNVYKNTGIDPNFHPPSRQGVSVLSGISEVWSVTETTDPAFKVALPVSAHIVIKAPQSEYISSADIESLVIRLLSTLYTQNSSGLERITALLRGSLVPQDVR